MIKITLQRNDSKEITDSISYTENTITLNEQEFAFPIGADLLFQSPHEQIINPKRDDKGILHATIIKQYIGQDKMLYEGENRTQILTDENIETKGSPITAELKVISEDELVQQELVGIETEIQTIENNALKSIIQDRIEGKI